MGSTRATTAGARLNRRPPGPYHRRSTTALVGGGRPPSLVDDGATPAPPNLGPRDAANVPLRLHEYGIYAKRISQSRDRKKSAINASTAASNAFRISSQEIEGVLR